MWAKTLTMTTDDTFRPVWGKIYLLVIKAGNCLIPWAIFVVCIYFLYGNITTKMFHFLIFYFVSSLISS